MAERFDFLVIGSGVAGLSFALKAARHGTVAIVTKKESAESNTNYGQPTPNPLVAYQLRMLQFGFRATF